MGQIEPRSPQSSNPYVPVFMIGRDRAGHWIAQDERGLCGGLFVNRAEAIKFALFENGHHPEAIIAVPDPLELDLKPTNSDTAPNPAAAAMLRAA